MTAVSVRRISLPRDASRKPAAAADANSSLVQPPSGPMANVASDTLVEDRVARNGDASLRSESMILTPSP